MKRKGANVEVDLPKPVKAPKPVITEKLMWYVSYGKGPTQVLCRLTDGVITHEQRQIGYPSRKVWKRAHFLERFHVSEKNAQKEWVLEQERAVRNAEHDLLSERKLLAKAIKKLATL